MNRPGSTLLPALLLAAGIVASTSVAVFTADRGWLAVAGPCLLALCAVLASVLGALGQANARERIRAAVILGAALLTAGLLVAFYRPDQLAVVLPILGAGTAVPIVLSPRRRQADCRR